MRRSQLLRSILLLVGLVTIALRTQAETEPTTPTTKDEIRTQIRQVMVVCDSQLTDIAEMISEDDMADLRSEHAAWEVERDRRCADTARDEAGDLEELELIELQCLLRLSEDRYVELESRISEFEGKIAIP